MKREPNTPTGWPNFLNSHVGRYGAVVVSLLIALLASGCSALDDLGYYWQSATGEWDLLARAHPIDEVIARSDDRALKTRLTRIAEIRAFASRDLGLPANGSYTQYADLGRPFVTWTVFATPKLSLSPRQWCFPVAGCVSYRGYFEKAAADGEARELQGEGDDVYIGPIPAYSTLGYFNDPVLSSFVNWPEADVARLIFHELAHQLIYAQGDTAFNESYAVTVERAGLERWLAHERDPKLFAQAARTERTRGEFMDIVRNTQVRLTKIYLSAASSAQKRLQKVDAFAAMMHGYETAKARDAALAAYEHWFANQPNNASIAALGLYADRVPAFQAILREEGNDLRRFYVRVRQLAHLPRAQRDRILDAYQNGTNSEGSHDAGL